jgi:DNA-binding PadR family transcriptional regulator
MATTSVDLSLNEWVVLALLAERPAHGFAIARELRADSDLGRILTVHRPLVYRALDRVAAAGLVEAHHTEPGDAGPNRTLHRVTRRGRRALTGWLTEPVQHVRDLRIEFLLKLRLAERAGRDAGPLVGAQRAALAETLDHLTQTDEDADVVELWRRQSARAAQEFLELLSPVGPDGSS